MTSAPAGSTPSPHAACHRAGVARPGRGTAWNRATARLLDTWPTFHSFLTSLTVIATLGQLMILQFVRRFDGRLMWLTLLQLLRRLPAVPDRRPRRTRLRPRRPGALLLGR